MRITRNADIDADALYDEDLDYREFMVEVDQEEKEACPSSSGAFKRSG